MIFYVVVAFTNKQTISKNCTVRELNPLHVAQQPVGQPLRKSSSSKTAFRVVGLAAPFYFINPISKHNKQWRRVLI